MVYLCNFNRKGGLTHMQQDLTRGSVLSNIRTFSPPYFLAYFLQALYGLADLYFIGRFTGAAVITAVAAGSQVIHMFTVMTVGFAMASTVLIGRAVGAHNDDGIRVAIGNSVTLFGCLALVFTVLLLALTRPLVSLLQIPAASVPSAVTYLTICFAGIPFIVAYNVIAAVFRGLGDSKSPMWFVAIACVTNIVLDYILIGPLHMGAAGAALGTILAQAVSVLLSLAAMKVRQLGYRISLRDLAPDRNTMRLLLKIGVPVTLQEGFIQVSFLLITVIANRRGVEIAAAVGIVEKIITFLFLVPSTMMATTSALAAQNLGAGKRKRAEETLFWCMGIAAGIGAVFFVVCNLFPEFIVGRFTGETAVVTYGSQYLRSYSIDCVIASIQFCFSGFFTACGKSFLSFAHNAVSIVTARVPGALFASIHWPETLFPMGLAAPSGSLISVVICVAAFLYLRRRVPPEL